MSIVWLDLETTGLNARKCKILEVGVIITDDKFVELARYHAVTNEARFTQWDSVDDYVINMHAKSGLWGQSLASKTTIEQVDRELEVMLDVHCYENDITHERSPDERRKLAPILGGNTVDFDRNFAEHHLPSFFGLLHYRSLNVSSLNELAKRVWPELHVGRPNNTEAAHRTIADIEESLRVCKHYATKLVPAYMLPQSE